MYARLDVLTPLGFSLGVLTPRRTDEARLRTCELQVQTSRKASLCRKTAVPLRDAHF